MNAPRDELLALTQAALEHIQGDIRAGHTHASQELPTQPLKPLALGTDAAVLATQDLPAIRQDLGDCTRCKLHSTRTHLVFGVGNPKADLMIVGEAPGRDEDLQGEPFVGRAGQLLTGMIEAIGLSRAEVYIANVIKCRPPENRNPEPDEIAQCEPFLKAQIQAINPKIICTLGKFATQTLLATQTPISQLRGQWATYEGISLLPTYHPAYLLRNPSAKKEVWADLKIVHAELVKRTGKALVRKG